MLFVTSTSLQVLQFTDNTILLFHMTTSFNAYEKESGNRNQVLSPGVEYVISMALPV